MKGQKEKTNLISRRSLLSGSAMILGGGILGHISNAAGSSKSSGDKTPPLPWKWVKLDPMEAGKRAYNYYKEKGGCGTGSYLSLLSLLREKVGYPWTTLPDMLMAHGAAGYGGHGTLCGALGGSSTIINMVTYGEMRDKYLQNSQLTDRLFWWYAEQTFPGERFDNLSPMPNQVKTKAMSPLCHTSLSKWMVAAGTTVNSDAKKERCAKVTAEVVYTVTLALNEFFAGKWTPPVWQPTKATEHCISCHGPDLPKQKAENWNQQGHMDCMMCHSDHTKS
jgi:hypothetical protein